MNMPGRKFTAATGYRYGFNGKENDKDISEGGQDYGMRIYDVRLGRFLSKDPLTKTYPFYSPYQFAGNSPIKFIDIDGKEPGLNELIKDYKGNLTLIAGATALMKNVLEPYITALKAEIPKSSGKIKSELQVKLAICQQTYAELMVYIFKIEKENENIKVGLAACGKITDDFVKGIQAMEEVVKWVPFFKKKSRCANQPY
ncbi:MAG: hypothetical protein IPP81_11480 [Chitinophagaceae bacterium]|nr:hypothetical protein [Chitinophagaceae bacterium]